MKYIISPKSIRRVIHLKSSTTPSLSNYTVAQNVIRRKLKNSTITSSAMRENIQNNNTKSAHNVVPNYEVPSKAYTTIEDIFEVLR